MHIGSLTTKIPVKYISIHHFNINEEKIKNYLKLLLTPDYGRKIIVIENDSFDSNKEIKEIELFKNFLGKLEYSNSSIDSSFFRYSAVKGSSYIYVMQLGEYLFNHGYDKSDRWVFNFDIPKEFGPEMLAYVAWKNNFLIDAKIVTKENIFKYFG